MDDVVKGDWSDDLHPRDENGRFAAASAAANAETKINDVKSSLYAKLDDGQVAPEHEAAHETATELLQSASDAMVRANDAAMTGGKAGGHMDRAMAKLVAAESSMARTGDKASTDAIHSLIESVKDDTATADKALRSTSTSSVSPSPFASTEPDAMKKSKKKTSVAKASKAVKHKAKAVSKNVEDLISPVLKELEGRVAVLESSTPSEVLAHRESVLDAGVADEMSLRKQADMAASAVTKEELLEQARIAALEEFTKMTNPS